MSKEMEEAFVKSGATSRLSFKLGWFAALSQPHASTKQLRKCGHPLGRERWCPDCELEEMRAKERR